ncbi:TPA: 50S ribosomal protein L22 [Patescibacteria group bacterium]|jgi:large subunit ribosomal protein L22|nr:50S ribosomal protein L22 [Patescibacteria group bacterium]
MAEKVAQPNNKPQVRAHARNLRISPRKIRLVTNLVKNMRVADALVQLQFTNKKAAGMVSKLLRSAVANAENNFSLKGEQLFIKSITTDMGPVLQRMFPRARGSAFVIRRKMAHVNVVLEERDAKPKSSAKLPKAKKKAEPIQTQEGQLGKAEAESVSKLKPEPKVKEVHRENEATDSKVKTSPENLQK